jgi:rSAM/selenodomain-associated transferase 1
MWRVFRRWRQRQRAFDQLGVFAKYWEPGKVKTRLATSLGAPVAAELYCYFLKAVIENCEHAFAGHRVLAYSPMEHRDAFSDLASDDWHLEPQSAGDLGQRMQHYFASAFESGCRSVVLVGSDSPNLPPAYIRSAFQRLESEHVVLGPSEDGGYYLIGARSELPDVFSDMSWSTGEVFAETVERLRHVGMSWHELPCWYDIDELADLVRLRKELAAQDVLSPARTELINKIDQSLL